jgi:hypothetical protein
VERYERLFDALGWLGLALLVPLGFYVFNYVPGVQFLRGRLGVAGLPTTITLAAFALIALRIVFGGGELVSPLLVSFVIGFFLLCTVVPFRFMRWYSEAAAKVFFLDGKALCFLAACFVLFFGNLLSYARRASIWLQLFLFLVLPAIFLLVANAFNLFRFPAPVL